jgi:uncharacterized membrane protein
MRAITVLSLALLVISTGCTQKSNPGGGNTRAATFTIEGPAVTPSIKQGDTQTLNVKINRGTDFREPVKLKVDPPKDIDVVLSESTVKPTDNSDLNVKVAVGNNATPGEHIIHVTGTPDKGNATTLDLKVKVTERTASAGSPSTTKLSLKGPTTETTIKQGESKTVRISIDNEPKYLVPVKLHAESPKGGLHAELTKDSIKASDRSETDLKISADKDATVGEHTIRITGTGDSATITPAEVKVKVVAK